LMFDTLTFPPMNSSKTDSAALCVLNIAELSFCGYLARKAETTLDNVSESCFVSTWALSRRFFGLGVYFAYGVINAFNAGCRVLSHSTRGIYCFLRGWIFEVGQKWLDRPC
jgi:hypothetical protein